jgi:hypothetical protein
MTACEYSIRRCRCVGQARVLSVVKRACGVLDRGSLSRKLEGDMHEEMVQWHWEAVVY